MKELTGFGPDPLFLLSWEEFEKYCDKIPSVDGWWWVRSWDDPYDLALEWLVNNGEDPSKLAPIVKDINRQWYHDYIRFSSKTVNVRPALNLRSVYSTTVVGEITKNSNEGRTHTITIDDINDKEKFVFNGITWVKLDDYIYISKTPIACHRFDSKSGVYKISEIRKFLWDWFGYERGLKNEKR